MKTTLNKIRQHDPCEEGWKKLLSHLGKTKADDEELPLLTILDSNGPEDALWCLRAVDGYDKEKRLFAVFCARQVQHLLTDQESIDAIDIAERFANGRATAEELDKARSAAERSAALAAESALAAAESAALAAVESAWVAALVAAESALVAAESEAWVAAESARSKQEKELRRILKDVK